MKMLKIILLVIVILVAIPFIIALFVNNDYTVQREITINRPKALVFDYIKHLKNQDYYSKWVRMDPNMKKDYTGTDGTVGFIYAWDGNKKAGKGEQEIKGIKEGELVDVEVRFEKPFASVASTPFMTQAVSLTETKVKWGVSGHSKYPMNFMNLFMNNMLGKDMDTSLAALKVILEKS